jgi:hypothetical protein
MMDNNINGDEQRPTKIRRLAIVMTSLIAAVVTYIRCPQIVTNYAPFPVVEPIFATSGISCSTAYMISAARQVEIILVEQMVAADEFSADRRFQKEDQFWNVYRGDSIDFYKDFRMSKTTFNQIVKDCVPYLYGSSQSVHVLTAFKWQELDTHQSSCSCSSLSSSLLLSKSISISTMVQSFHE